MWVVGETQDGWYKISYQGKESYIPKDSTTDLQVEIEGQGTVDLVEAGLDGELAAVEAEGKMLVEEVERRLGKRLSAADLKSLYTLYDHLALPAEVILMLVGWCGEETERKYGSGRRPFLSQIKREGFAWARRGVDTMERAEEHIARLTRLRDREAEVLRLLDIPSRPLVQREKDYIAVWDEMGFDDEAVRMAYERTVFQKNAMNWPYMNKILTSWHGAGYQTPQQVEAGDKPPRRTAAPVAARPRDFQPSQERIRESADWLDKFLEEQKKGGG